MFFNPVPKPQYKKKRSRADFWSQANKINGERYGEYNFCECCLRNGRRLDVAHRHKRLVYKTVAQATAYDQTAVLCRDCHNKIEYNRELTEAVFMRIRGNDVTFPHLGITCG